MRAVIQRVTRASVLVNGDNVAEIGPGLLVLVGITHSDTEKTAIASAEKIKKLRIFEDNQGRMNEPLAAREVLCVSQFTLYADTRKGNRPSFIAAAPPEKAQPLYDFFCRALNAKKGIFGARMDIELVNDGPVTVVVEN